MNSQQTNARHDAANNLAEIDTPPVITVIGKESVGKTQLLATLTGSPGDASNFRGSTVTCDEYAWNDQILIDTPGIIRESDAVTTQLALASLNREECVLLVVQATHLDEDLADLLPLVVGKRTAIIISFWDKVAQTAAAEAAVEQLRRTLNVPVVTVDSRRLNECERQNIQRAMDDAATVGAAELSWRSGWRIEPRPGILEHRWFGPALALLLLIAPAMLAVQLANNFAGLADPIVREWLSAWVTAIQSWPESISLVKAVLVGDYGLFTMGPLLFVWAAPTVVLFAVLIGLYKASGLVDRINAALHSLVRPLGISGRDVTRIVMGFGCNVPAVISTRSCSSCSRGACISAIAFGSACSYQLPATLAVFGAVGAPWLAIPFLSYLLVTTIVYMRITSSASARSALNRLLIERRTFMQLPTLRALWREVRSTLRQFFLQAMPTFVLIASLASVLHWCGVLGWLAQGIAPLMGLFRLPGEAALPIVMASIRKDGILLFAASSDATALAFPLSHAQVLTGTYLAGVLLPCLVTVLTIAREQSWLFAAKLLARQLLAAVVFTLVLAWGVAQLLP
jgi:ferrous iron transport protein B